MFPQSTLMFRPAARNAALFVCSLLALSAACNRSQHPQLSVRVERVVDGDTLIVAHNDASIEVRLAGLECPELTQPYGREVTQHVADRCQGKEIVIEERRRDDNGCIHGVIMIDGANLNQELAAAGFVHVTDRSAVDPPVAAAADEAERSFRGIWKAFAPPIEPAEWRKMTEKIERSDEHPLNGIWEIVGAEWMGRENPGSSDGRYLFQGSELVIVESPTVTVRQFVLRADADPPEINYTQETKDGTVEILGIYQLDGDQLTLCNSRHSQPRPKVFMSSTTEVGCSLLQLRRVE